MPVLSMRECSSARLLIRPRDLGDAAPAGIRRSLLRGAAPFICSLGSHSGRVVALRTSDRIVVPVTAQHDTYCSLQAYMRLPVSQYVLMDVPLGGSLKRVGEDIFDVIVPHVRFFDLWVQPRVRCKVRLLNSPERVDIRCVQCILDGSPGVKQLRLDDHVEFDVHTCFTPQQGPPAIQSESHINVLVDPPGPFRYLPDFILKSVGEAALKASLSTLQRVFINSLGRDYAKWASDSVYREERERWAVQSELASRQAQPV